MKKLTAMLLCLLFASCASKKLQNEAQPLNPLTKDNKLKVSSEIVEDLSDIYNILLQINFENKGGQWMRIDSAELDLPTIDKVPYNIIVGKDLMTWVQAKDEEKKIREQNEQIGATAGILGGTALVLAGARAGSKDLVDVGSAAFLGGTAYGTGKELQRDQKKAHGSSLVPEGHLYAPFNVPSMSLMKRWILVNIPTGRVARTGKLILKTVEGETYTYILRITE